MIVVRKESTIFRDENKNNNLKGIRCRWFTINNELQEVDNKENIYDVISFDKFTKFLRSITNTFDIFSPLF